MKKFTLFAAAALVALGSSVATAQDTTKKEAKGEVITPPTIATVVLAIDASVATKVKIDSVKVDSAGTIELIDVKSLITSPADDSTFKAALERNKDAIKALQEALKTNGMIVKAINDHAQKPEPGDVIGAEVRDGTKLVLYFWKK